MPHTKQQLQQLLDTAGVSPRHRWGQNFLIDLNLMRLLVDKADLRGNETVLEVGCGTGSLTDLIAPLAGAVIAVEIDRGLAQIAQSELAQHKNVSIINSDVLDNKSTINRAILDNVQKARLRLKGHFYLMANLPYQVASPVIINLLLSDSMPNAMFFTVQAEVAWRMTAEPGNKSYGRLSILMQATGDVKQLRTVGPQAFWPTPKVSSAMIVWRRNDDKCRTINDLPTVKQMIDLLLGHRRKTINSCLAQANLNFDYHRLLVQANINDKARGETLPPQKFVELANLRRQL